MQIKSVGWIVGSLGLLLGAGSAGAEEEAKGNTGQDVVNQLTQAPQCKDAGVTVSFTTGSYELDVNARGALNGVVTWLKSDEKRTLRVAGFADTTGNTEANMVLSEHRADAVKTYLVAQGIDATRVITAGRGEIAEHMDHLPADGRTVTFLACAPPPPLAAAEPEPAPPAEEVAPPPPPEVYPVAVVPPSNADEGTGAHVGGTGFGWAFMLGGAYTDFTNSDMRSRTQAGGGWDARIVGGMRSFIGFEAAYVGAARGLTTLGATANNPLLVSNGVEGNIRINVPIIAGHSLIEPYGFVGVGWSRYAITNFNSNTANFSDFTRNDDVMTVPVGGGLAYGYKNFIMDVRGSYTPTYYNNLLTATNGTGTLNSWGAGGQVGFLF